MGKLDVRAKKWEKNPAMLRIIRMFEDAFNSIGEKIRKDLLKAYREHARAAFDHFMRTALGTAGSSGSGSCTLDKFCAVGYIIVQR